MAKAVFSHPLKPSELMIAYTMAYRSMKSLMVWGAPGIGKSMMGQQFADMMFPLYTKTQDLVAQLKAEIADPAIPTQQSELDALVSKIVQQDDNLIDFRLSQVDPVDLRGCPVPVTYTFTVDEDGKESFIPECNIIEGMNVRKKTQTVWAPPGMLDLPEDWKGVIFMDEVNGAIPVVQAAAYQLFLDRCIGEMKLPKGAFILAAGNRECDGGVTFQLATPLKDRMTHVELIADLDEWTKNYAFRAKVHPDCISYLQTRGADFNTLSPNNPNICGGSSPRSWVTTSDYCYDFESGFYPQDRAHTRVFYSMIEGTLGDDVAQRFKTHREMTAKLPPAMDILRGKVVDANALPDMDISKHFAITSNVIYKMLDLYENFKHQQVEKAEFSKYATNFLQFVDVSYGDREPEMAMMAVKSLFEHKCYFNPIDVPFYREFAKKHHALLVKARSI